MICVAAKKWERFDMGLAEKRIREINREEQSSRDWLIKEYLPYVKRIVYRFSKNLPPSVDTEDLIHVGVIGLMQAMESFNPEMENKFITYAVFRIKGAILSELRSRDYLSRKNRKKIRELDNAYLSLERKYQRGVDDYEVAEEFGLEIEQLHEIKNLTNIGFVSFDEIECPSGKIKDGSESVSGAGTTADAFTLIQLKEIKSALSAAIEKLPEKEAMVISLYYMDELTMKEIGKVLDVSESRVSQIHSHAINRLRRRLKGEKDEESCTSISASMPFGELRFPEGPSDCFSDTSPEQITGKYYAA